MTEWPTLRTNGWLEQIGGGDRAFARYWRTVFDRVYLGEVDSWAYRWTYSCWRTGGLTILPSRNLVVNIGLMKRATHTSKRLPRSWKVPMESIEFPLVHPKEITRDISADMWTDKNVFRISSLRAMKLAFSDFIKRLK